MPLTRSFLESMSTRVLLNRSRLEKGITVVFRVLLSLPLGGEKWGGLGSWETVQQPAQE